ncbi:MAG: hypothetical protein VZS12_12165, partial [Ruminococcus bromii]|nr:hypothetical protein [Ruminococcus bromii]
VTGNILGAWLGYEAIEQKWLKNLELKDVILEIAEDLAQGCRMNEYSDYYDPKWAAKYIDMRRTPELATKNKTTTIEDFINSSGFDRMNRELRNKHNTENK